ncbi:MAG: transcription/translation regulatory transformer protein RfaH [Gammaproteobacteria bacterium]|jgi:transcriptional antiterminator RfaH|nr:transcription/translation regulatory transformer protein RfaH [Gammaproteobacteria bacterium]
MYAWYVVYTKPRKEALAETNLQRQEFETYLPWFKRVTAQRGTWKETVEPLFPRYLFLRTDPTKQTVAPIRSTLGVSTLVTFGHQLMPVPDKMIDALRQRADPSTGVHCAPQHEFKKGEAVAITSGPFEGLQGIFDTCSGEARVAVLLDILGKSARVLLKRAQVEPA